MVGVKKGIYIKCPCGNDVYVTKSRTKKKYCSEKCFRKYRSYECSTKTRDKIAKTLTGNIPWNKGKKATMSARIKQSLGHTNDKEFTGFKATEAIQIRNSLEYGDWITNVKKRDGYVCYICGEYIGKNNANISIHHIKNFAKHPNLRMDINNGITLHRKCHKMFHLKYGKYNNTQEQLDELKEIVRNGRNTNK